jgi:hypothetical protein
MDVHQVGLCTDVRGVDMLELKHNVVRGPGQSPNPNLV